MLEAAGVAKHYAMEAGATPVLSGVDLQLQRGDSLAIVGPSGCGKSTLLHILGGLDAPTAGSVRLDGVDPYALDARHLAAFRNRQVGLVFQDHHLLPQCSVLENVLVPTYVSGAAHEAQVRSARSLLDRVGLGHRLSHRPGELSGGEKQRVAIARALINEPRLLLCDEPTGNLDEVATTAVADLLLDLHQARGTVLVVVTHNLELARRFDVIQQLTGGRLRAL